MDIFLFHIIRNRLKVGPSQSSFMVKTPLVALTANQAARMSRSFAAVLMANVGGTAAVDEFIMTYPALGELDQEYVWLRPMMVAIADENMTTVA